MQNVLNRLVAPIFLARGKNVVDVQKSGALQPYVNKSGLHAGQHPHDFAFVDIANQTALGASLDMQVLKYAVDHHSHARLLRRAVN